MNKVEERDNNRDKGIERERERMDTSTRKVQN